MAAVRVRDGDLADSEALAAIDAAVFGREAWSPAGIRAEVEVPGRVLVAVGADGAMTGYAVVSVAATSAELRRIAVADPARRGGVGTELLLAVLDRAGELGCDEVFLEVGATNEAAQALYRSAGFRRVGARPAYYASGEDALVYRLALQAAT